MGENYAGVIERYRERLPVDENTPVVSLGEGGTKLIELKKVPRLINKKVRLYAKFEGLNPTGSFKDRGMTLAVSKAVEAGAKAIICASTGNTSAAAAAYAARAGIACFVVIPEGKVALGKLSQAMMHGSKVMQIKGNFDDGMKLVQEVAQELPVTLVNSTNPYRLQGQKTAAFEIIEELGDAPDYHALPVGNAGNITAHWIGYCEAVCENTQACTFCNGQCTYHKSKLASLRPIMLGYQASGAAPFLRGGPVKNPETVASAIRIGNPVSWKQAWKVKEESGGWFAECTDEEILRVQKLLAKVEGVFCEPSSATSVAGVIKDLEQGTIGEGAVIVCTLTGHGLKDPDIAIKQSGIPVTIEATREAIEKIIAENMPK